MSNQPTELIKGQDYIGVCVVYFCHDGSGAFVLHKRTSKTRDEHGVWDVGGGGLRFGETVEEALRREILEEVGVEPLEQEFLGYLDVHREHQGKPTHWIALDFKVRVDRSQVMNAEPDVFSELGWFRLDSLPDNLHSQLPVRFERYQRQLWASE